MASQMGTGVMHDSLDVVMTFFIVVVKGDGIKNLIFFLSSIFKFSAWRMYAEQQNDAGPCKWIFGGLQSVFK